MNRFVMLVCACVLLAGCSALPYDPYGGDPDATKVAKNQYSLCLTESAARLDDGRSEVVAIEKAVVDACYSRFVEIQIADGDAAREEFMRAHSPPSAEIMHKQDVVEQDWLATQAIKTHRHNAAEL